MTDFVVGAKKLAFASFFFWRNGSTAEKSLDGLCRSILHCLLAERRELIAEVFPQQWKEAEQSPWRIQSCQEIPSREVQAALEMLLQDTRLYQHRKFCIFIDGLDEFEPGLHDGLDYVDLVDILRRSRCLQLLTQVHHILAQKPSFDWKRQMFNSCHREFHGTICIVARCKYNNFWYYEPILDRFLDQKNWS